MTTKYSLPSFLRQIFKRIFPIKKDCVVVSNTCATANA